MSMKKKGKREGFSGDRVFNVSLHLEGAVPLNSNLTVQEALSEIAMQFGLTSTKGLGLLADRKGKVVKPSVKLGAVGGIGTNLRVEQTSFDFSSVQTKNVAKAPALSAAGTDGIVKEEAGTRRWVSERRKIERIVSSTSNDDKRATMDRFVELQQRMRSEVRLGDSIENILKKDKRGRAEIPVLVEVCVEHIRKHGLDAEGIFRVSAPQSVLNDLKREFNAGHQPVTEDTPPHACADLIKMFLRHLPKPLFPETVFNRLLSQRPMDRKISVEDLVALPLSSRVVLKSLLDLFREITEHSELNLMEPRALGTVIGPNMIRPERKREEATDTKSLSMVEQMARMQSLMTTDLSVAAFTDLLTNYEELFQGVMLFDVPHDLGEDDTSDEMVSCEGSEPESIDDSEDTDEEGNDRADEVPDMTPPPALPLPGGVVPDLLLSTEALPPPPALT